MKRFVWRLQHVLDIRTNEEQTKRTELLKITERLAEARGELLTRQAILRDMIANIAKKKPHKRLGEQEFFLKHSAASEEQIKTLKARVRALESEQRQRMAEVLKIKRSKESLEKLRAEAKRQYIEQQEKLEQKELDEIAGISFVRKKNPVLQVR
jgi:flagellar biosynthesis chaperone FliJ